MSKFTMSAFGDEIAVNLEEQMTELEKYGIKYIETRNIDGKNIADYTVSEIKEVKKRMDARGFGVSALGSPIGKIGVYEDFGAHFDKFRNCLDLAAELNCKYIRMFAFYVPDVKNIAPYREAVLARWTEFLSAAKSYDITLLSENEGGLYSESAEGNLDVVKTLNSPKVKAIFDPANYVVHGHDTLKAFDLTKDYTIYFHIKDARASDRKVVACGNGDGHVEEILRNMYNSGFEGFLSIEPHLLCGDIAVGGVKYFEEAADAIFAIKERIEK